MRRVGNVALLGAQTQSPGGSARRLRGRPGIALRALALPDPTRVVGLGFRDEHARVFVAVLEPVDEGGPFGLLGLPLFLFLPRELAGALFAPLPVELFLLPQERGVRFVSLDVSFCERCVLAPEPGDALLGLGYIDVVNEVEGYWRPGLEGPME